MNWMLNRMIKLHDSLVLPSMLSLLSSFIYLITYTPFFGLLGIASLLVYNVSVTIIFIRFTFGHSLDSMVTTNEVVGEKLIISAANLMGIYILFAMEF